MLSAQRAQEVADVLVRRGVKPENITPVFYGDSRAKANQVNRRVEFLIRKRDLNSKGRRVRSQ